MTRRGLSTVNDSNNGSQKPSGDRDANNRYVESSSNNHHYYDDHRMDNHNVMRVHPRERDFMVHDHIGGFWGHDPHYFGYRIHALPPKYVRVRYYGVDYFRYGNVYYRAHAGYYVVVRPPFGIVVDAALHSVGFHHVHFAYYPSVYRSYTFDSYSRYIDAQNREIARNNAILAQQNLQMAMNVNSANRAYEVAKALGLAQSYAYADQEYFYDDGVFYIIRNGKYQTIVPPAGALVEELPDDYDTITLGNAEYYRVDDTVYKVTMLDGHPYLEVLGQMYGKMARKYSIF